MAIRSFVMFATFLHLRITILKEKCRCIWIFAVAGE